MNEAGHNMPESEKREPVNKESVNDSVTIPVVEEQIHVSTKKVESEKVLIHKSVKEEEVTVEVPVVQEELDVERVEVNRYIDTAPPGVRYEGDTMIVPVFKEVVEKRLVLVEELHIKKRKVTNNSTEKVTLRKEEVTVERVPGRPDSPGGAAGMSQENRS